MLAPSSCPYENSEKSTIETSKAFRKYLRSFRRPLLDW